MEVVIFKKDSIIFKKIRCHFKKKEEVNVIDFKVKSVLILRTERKIKQQWGVIF